AHSVTLDRELESVAGTLHDSLELKLKQPGRLEPIVRDFLPNFCLVGTSCVLDNANRQRHVVSAIDGGSYYVKIFDLSGSLIAIAGSYPSGISPILNKEYSQNISDNDGNLYRQISLSLHTQDSQDWGYFQVGRSWKDFEDYLKTVRWVLILGIPISLIIVGSASWWLAGLAMEPIYRSYQQIQQFTADAAHELRTPLAATQATIESALLIPDLEQKEARDILGTIERQNRRLTQLVADLLLLSRMDREAIQIRREKCCLNDIVSDLVEEFTPLAMASKITITSDVRVKNNLAVLGDSAQLYRLVSNLIVNAIQYTLAEGNVRVILDSRDRIAGASRHRNAIIQVQDTGIGIPPEEQSRIFDRFYRIKSDRSRRTGGSGLGLAIAKAIVQSHQGTIHVESKVGVGSTFTVEMLLVNG
ncbi:MAG TPA: two-component sensor histidine kinase, partial [Cyanobacteria bacterium UBA11166]|nr:two-component sensor histidine kinase [Cyanobacteria bacterium UBA11166]